jgi:hypothetical protein
MTALHFAIPSLAPAQPAGNAAFFSFAAVALLTLIACFGYGISHWKLPRGKVVTLVAALLLVAVVAFVVSVFLVSSSAQRGAPM